MMIALLFFILDPANASLDKLLTVGTFYESNSYYEDKSDKGDFFISVKPELMYEPGKKKGFLTSAYGMAQYNKYFVHSNLDFFQYEGHLKIQTISDTETGFFLKPSVKTLSEPPINETGDRPLRQFMGAEAGAQWRSTELSRFEIEGNYQTEAVSFNPPSGMISYDFQQNYEINMVAKHLYSFLPETNLVTALKVGQKIFPEGTKYKGTPNEEFGLKYDSQYIEVGSGVVGRLTRTMKIRSYAGFLFREYAKEAGFREPIFTLEFEEERSPRDMILLGYDYTVEDTYYSNFVLKQKMHIGFGRIFGDQLLALARLSYQYRSYSRPNRREDQRLAGEFKLDYSFSKTFKAEAVFTADLLTSETLGPAGTVDPSVSYEYIRAGLFLKNLF